MKAALIELHSFDLFFPIGARIVEYMHKTKVHQFPKDNSEQSPFQYAHDGLAFFEYFDKVPEQRKYFDDYMALRRVGLATWYETFPMAQVLCPDAKKESTSVLLVDVGGNWGHEISAFHQAHPDAPGRLILQDLPSMIQKVEKEAPPKGVECMAYDFFTPQPVKGMRTRTTSSESATDRTARCPSLLFPQHLPRLARLGVRTVSHQYRQSHGEGLLSAAD